MLSRVFSGATLWCRSLVSFTEVTLVNCMNWVNSMNWMNWMKWMNRMNWMNGMNLVNKIDWLNWVDSPITSLLLEFCCCFYMSLTWSKLSFNGCSSHLQTQTHTNTVKMRMQMIRTDTNSNVTTNSDMNLVSQPTGKMPIVSCPVLDQQQQDSVAPDTWYKYRYK